MVTKWQYKVVQLGGAGAEVVDEELLNSLGDEGWNLVSVNDYGNDWVKTPSVAYLKKKVTRAESGPP